MHCDDVLERRVNQMAGLLFHFLKSGLSLALLLYEKLRMMADQRDIYLDQGPLSEFLGQVHWICRETFVLFKYWPYLPCLSFAELYIGDFSENICFRGKYMVGGDLVKPTTSIILSASSDLSIIGRHQCSW
jgi:hypothetical protein